MWGFAVIPPVILDLNGWETVYYARHYTSGKNILESEGDALVIGLSVNQKSLTNVADAVMASVWRIIRACVALKVPVVLEHPRASRIWTSKECSKLFNVPCAAAFDLDMCRFGTRWRRPTSYWSGASRTLKSAAALFFVQRRVHYLWEEALKAAWLAAWETLMGGACCQVSVGVCSGWGSCGFRSRPQPS